MARELEVWASLLKEKKNIILEGVPGTGKTHSIEEIISTYIQKFYGDDESKIGAKARENFAMTMHPSTTYEDFIEGIKPNLEVEKCDVSSSLSIKIRIGELGDATLSYNQKNLLTNIKMDWKNPLPHEIISFPQNVQLPTLNINSDTCTVLIEKRYDQSKCEFASAYMPNLEGDTDGVTWAKTAGQFHPSITEIPGEQAQDFLDRYENEQTAAGETVNPDQFYINAVIQRPGTPDAAINNITIELRGGDSQKGVLGTRLDGGERLFYSFDISFEDDRYNIAINDTIRTEVLVDLMHRTIENYNPETDIFSDVFYEQNTFKYGKLYAMTNRPEGGKWGIRYDGTKSELPIIHSDKRILFIEENTATNKKTAHVLSLENDCCSLTELMTQNPDWDFHQIHSNFTFLPSMDCDDEDSEENLDDLDNPEDQPIEEQNVVVEPENIEIPADEVGE
jgi:hypothetical protein